MPTYVYKFVDTGETIEVQQSFEDDSLTEAVHPGSGATMKVKKVFTPVGVTFKGGGFYKTDSRGGSSKSGVVGRAGRRRQLHVDRRTRARRRRRRRTARRRPPRRRSRPRRRLARSRRLLSRGGAARR